MVDGEYAQAYQEVLGRGHIGPSDADAEFLCCSSVKSYQSNGTITATFEWKDKTKRTYSHQLHTKTQSR